MGFLLAALVIAVAFAARALVKPSSGGTGGSEDGWHDDGDGGDGGGD